MNSRLSTTSKSISILVADANAMVCELLASAFKRRRPFIVAACATNLKEFQEVAETTQIDVALIGTSLQDGKGSGLKAVGMLRRLQPNSRVVVMLERSEQNTMTVEAFRAGARGVFCRSEKSFDILCKCINRVHAGEIWANSKQLEFLIEGISQGAPLRVLDRNGMNMLSSQEDKVVHLVANGLTNREIASELGLSEHTVKNYLFKIFDKLGVSTRVELALYAMSNSESSRGQAAAKIAV